MKKQAAGHYGELNAPWDGKEYRGAGLPDALDAVLKDQPTPVIGQIEYSTDGAQWAPLDGQELSGSLSVRATVEWCCNVGAPARGRPGGRDGHARGRRRDASG